MVTNKHLNTNKAVVPVLSGNNDGIIVTNNHVVEGADSIVVEFSDGYRADAKIIGTDPASDLAAIQVNVSDNYIKPITLTDSTQVKNR